MMKMTRFAPAALLLALASSTASAQTPARMTVTLDDAIKMATEHSEALKIAGAGEQRADADKQRARSLRMPQLTFSGSYDRTLASEFSDAFGSSSGSGGGSTGGLDLSNLPFGQKNVYRANLSFSQAIYSGGRIDAQRELAELAAKSAAMASSTTRAQVTLDVTRAFFDAALSDRLLAIAESTYQQAGASYEQARMAFEAGRQPEFEQLRARVARDNLQPLVIRRRADRDTAYLRLRQLLELPPSAAIVLDVDLDAPALSAPAPFAESLAKAVDASPAAAESNINVRLAESVVSIRESAIAIAKSQRKPSVNLNSAFGQVGYPSNPFTPGFGDFHTNWTLGAQVVLPLYTGGRLTADESSARADLYEASARLKQARELVELDLATARQDLTAAEAVWTASSGSIQQAQRAYEIADLRYREGISTQLELSDARLLLQSAQANRAQAAHDLQLARARLALIDVLPVGSR